MLKIYNFNNIIFLNFIFYTEFIIFILLKLIIKKINNVYKKMNKNKYI